MAEPEKSFSRRAVLDEEEAAWREMCARFDRLGPEDWERPGVNAEWTPKDLLAHIACWHAEAEGMMERHRIEGGAPPWRDTDEFNAEAHRRCAGMTIKEVQSMSGAARHRFREEAALLPERLPEALANVVVFNGQRHYREHAADFDRFLEKA